MALNLKRLMKRAREYVEVEANTRVKNISFEKRFHLLGAEDVVLSVITTDKDDPELWVVGGDSPMNLYSKSDFRSADEVFTMHIGLLLRISARDFESSTIEPEEIGYDAFISHASEDKSKLVRPLANELEKMGFRIWYDEFELRVGDSLRQSIDRGLVNSRFGIVILSKAFFSKNWPQYELNGLTAREMDGQKVILPIWYKINREEVIQFSPTLADKIAAVTNGQGIKKVAAELAKALEE